MKVYVKSLWLHLFPFFITTPLQACRLPYCSWNRPDTISFRVGIYCVLWNSPHPDICMTPFLTFLRSLLNCHVIKEDFTDHNITNNNSTPLALVILNLFYLFSQCWLPSNILNISLLTIISFPHRL